MTFRYIGSKARVIEELAKHIGLPTTKNGRFIDAFCGTGVVALKAADNGWPIWVNDQLISAGVISSARMISVEVAKFSRLGGYVNAVNFLNNLQPIEGFIWKEYSPASIHFTGVQRKYFLDTNAGKIDAIRRQIQAWAEDSLIQDLEKNLLIADLLSATNRVANIAGTYGCFLSTWTNQALKPLEVKARKLFPLTVSVRVTSENVIDLDVEPNDVVYLDPPYTKRQYASYYHILETITIGDSPIVEGVSGLRPWRLKASDYCYRNKALPALTTLISKLNTKRILLSYSNAGHIPIEELFANIKSLGSVTTFELKDVGSYRPNTIASNNRASVKEYLIVIDK